MSTAKFYAIFGYVWWVWKSSIDVAVGHWVQKLGSKWPIILARQILDQSQFWPVGFLPHRILESSDFEPIGFLVNRIFGTPEFWPIIFLTLQIFGSINGYFWSRSSGPIPAISQLDHPILFKYLYWKFNSWVKKVLWI